MNIAAANFNPWPEEQLLSLKRELESLQVTAAAFNRCYAHIQGIRPEALQVAQVIAEGEHLQHPFIAEAVEKHYHKTLAEAQDGDAAPRIIYRWLMSLVPAFKAGGLI